MKKLATFLLSAFLLFSGLTLIAQDTLDVPWDFVNEGGNTTGSLNAFINADTLANGGMIPDGRVYRLERGKYYLLSQTIQNYNASKLTLVGAMEPADMQPPVVASGLFEDGSKLTRHFSAAWDVEFRNIYFKGFNPQGLNSGRCLRVIRTDSVTVTIDNCVFDGFDTRTLWFHTSRFGKVKFTNNYMRNFNAVSGHDHSGRGWQFYLSEPFDTVEIVNNTFVNLTSVVMGAFSTTPAKYINFDHNTIVNNMRPPLGVNMGGNANVTNTIFYNANAYGETLANRIKSQDNDDMVYGLIHADTLVSDSIMAESDRIFNVLNNAYWWEPEILAYMDARDTVDGGDWLNERAQAMFDNDTEWPGFTESDNINSEIHFTNLPAVTTTNLLDFMNKTRDDIEKTQAENLWGHYPDGNYFQIYWPLETIEDYSYATSDPAYTAGTGGFPIGNLNHFPDKKAEWEIWLPTGVELNNEINKVPVEYTLNQNYPNPFNPTTVIEFSIPEKNNVELDVFNTLGQKVGSLVNEELKTGNYKFEFNSSGLSSGIYFYRLKVGDSFTQIKKMILMK